MLNFNRIIYNDSHSYIAPNYYVFLSSIRCILSLTADDVVKFLYG